MVFTLDGHVCRRLIGFRLGEFRQDAVEVAKWPYGGREANQDASHG